MQSHWAAAQQTKQPIDDDEMRHRTWKSFLFVSVYILWHAVSVRFGLRSLAIFARFTLRSHSTQLPEWKRTMSCIQSLVWLLLLLLLCPTTVPSNGPWVTVAHAMSLSFLRLFLEWKSSQFSIIKKIFCGSRIFCSPNPPISVAAAHNKSQFSTIKSLSRCQQSGVSGAMFAARQFSAFFLFRSTCLASRVWSLKRIHANDEFPFTFECASQRNFCPQSRFPRKHTEPAMVRSSNS